MSDERPTLTVMMGAPAAGKTTWCAANADGAVVLTCETIKKGANPGPVFDRMLCEARRALVRRRDVIIDACSTMKPDRSQWLHLARRLDARTRLVVLDTPSTLCNQRDSKRRRPVNRNGVYTERMKAAKRDIRRESWDEIVVVTP